MRPTKNRNKRVSRPRGSRIPAKKAGRHQADLVRRLETELRVTKKEQQHLVEQLESSNEELKAANEEVLSMNEEPTTLNAQLQDKVQELTSVNVDGLRRAT
jgi:two-component system CheB/CheR fusion protein